MTNRKSTFRLLALAAATAALQGCGGGGNGGVYPMGQAATPEAKDPPAAEAGAGADAGSVSAKFVPNDQARFMLLAAGSQVFGNRLTDSEQSDNGAMIRLGTNSLSGASETVDIAGDASFALGRWVRGTVTRTSGADTLTGNDAQSHHYIAFNGLAALPAGGDANCTVAAFTAPTS